LAESADAPALSTHGQGGGIGKTEIDERVTVRTCKGFNRLTVFAETNYLVPLLATATNNCSGLIERKFFGCRKSLYVLLSQFWPQFAGVPDILSLKKEAFLRENE